MFAKIKSGLEPLALATVVFNLSMINKCQIQPFAGRWVAFLKPKLSTNR